MVIAVRESTLITPCRGVPELRLELVQRRELLQHLLTTDVPVVLVTGPPGYGKTTLLLQLAHTDPRPSAWLCLDEADNNEGVLLSRLVDALGNFEPLDPDLVPALFGDPQVSEVLPAITRLMAERKEPFTLLVDDLDAIWSPAALAILAAISARIPSGSRLVMGSRRMPDLGIGRLRARRRVLEIGAQDLALAPNEAAALVRGAGVDLSREDTDLLTARTEGWATGLYLAALSLRSGTSSAASFSGDDPLITDYLWDEVLRPLPESIVEFLIHSAMLRHLTGSTCDAVLGRKGSGALLRELNRSNVFMVPLDRHQETYRHHFLFAQALTAELHRRDPDIEAELHRRASAWYGSKGKTDESIGHSTAAQDIPRAAEQIWSAISNGRSAPPEALERWLSAFSEAEITAHPLLALAMAWLSTLRGDGPGLDRWVSIAERGYFRGQLPGGPATLGAAVSLLRAILGRQGIARMTRDASQAYELDGNHGRWRAVARYLQGIGLRLQGDRDGAGVALEECERRLHGHVCSTYAECLAQLALIASEEGDRLRCNDLAERAVKSANELHHRGDPPSTLVYAVMAMIQAQAGDQVPARSHLRMATSARARAPYSAPYLEVECLIVLARAKLALSDGAGARRLVAEARLAMREASDSVVLAGWIDEVSQAIYEFPVPSHDGGASLTAAELRVLHLLPTHLTFPEIGARLSLSRNTVKTQALSVYRKLGVGSRAEAVERARSLGLLEALV